MTSDPPKIDILRAGAYNLGFIVISRSRNAGLVLMWWQQRLFDHCVEICRAVSLSKEVGRSGTGMFERVAIVRDAGYNVAYWNLSHRVVSLSENGYKCGWIAVVILPLSVVRPGTAGQIVAAPEPLHSGNLPPERDTFCLATREDLLSAGYLACKAWPYAFGTFSKRDAHPRLGRPIHTKLPNYSTPSTIHSDDGFRRLPSSGTSPVRTKMAPSRISRLAYRIYRTRTDVQSGCRTSSAATTGHY